MPWSLRKSLKLGPGIRLNLGKKSASRMAAPASGGCRQIHSPVYWARCDFRIEAHARHGEAGGRPEVGYSGNDVFARLTVRRVAALGQLAHGRTERAAAEALGLQIEGFRSVVRELKEITGLNSTRDLGEWWRRNMGAWLECVSTIAQGEVSPDSWTG